MYRKAETDGLHVENAGFPVRNELSFWAKPSFQPNSNAVRDIGGVRPL